MMFFRQLRPAINPDRQTKTNNKTKKTDTCSTVKILQQIKCDLARCFLVCLFWSNVTAVILLQGKCSCVITEEKRCATYLGRLCLCLQQEDRYALPIPIFMLYQESISQGENWEEKKSEEMIQIPSCSCHLRSISHYLVMTEDICGHLF